MITENESRLNYTYNGVYKPGVRQSIIKEGSVNHTEGQIDRELRVEFGLVL